MGIYVSAYVERLDKESGKWELVTQTPISGGLKYIFDDYDNFQTITWNDLSDELKLHYKLDNNGQPYASFRCTTLQELESINEKSVTLAFTKLNAIVKALGCNLMFSDTGEENQWYGDDDEDTDKLTFPVNKELIEDLQMSYESLRKVGQREAFDLVFDQYMEYDKEYRIVFVIS